MSQGAVVLEKQMFTSYRFEPLPNPQLSTQEQDSTTQDNGENEASQLPLFAISLTALLETLQIFGFAENKDRSWTARTDTSYSSGIHGSRLGGGLASTAFDSRTLGMAGFCRISYNSLGSPLSVTLEEGNVTTTCDLMTYEPETIMGNSDEDADDFEIPFDRNTLTQKVIMRSVLLHDAITELASTNPERLTIISSQKAPFFSLSATGPLGSTTVDFNKDAMAAQAKEGTAAVQLLETFQVASQRLVNTYKFSMIRAAVRAMALAEKVSIRTDDQGVLNLQFMVPLEAGYVTFVDFKLVPFIPEDGDEEDEDDADAEGDETSSAAGHDELSEL